MQTIRRALAVLTFVLLVGGYFLSQAAYRLGRAGEYARAIDQPAVKWLALALVVGAIVCALIPEKEGGNPQ